MRVKCLAQEHNTVCSARARTWTICSGVQHTNHKARCLSALVVHVDAKLTRLLFYILQSTKGQSLRIQRNQDDDSDGPVYSDVDDAPTPPPHRRALGPSASLPAYRTDHDFYGRKESGVTVLPKMRVYK